MRAEDDDNALSDFDEKTITALYHRTICTNTHNKEKRWKWQTSILSVPSNPHFGGPVPVPASTDTSASRHVLIDEQPETCSMSLQLHGVTITWEWVSGLPDGSWTVRSWTVSSWTATLTLTLTLTQSRIWRSRKWHDTELVIRGVSQQRSALRNSWTPKIFAAHLCWTHLCPLEHSGFLDQCQRLPPFVLGMWHHEIWNVYNFAPFCGQQFSYEKGVLGGFLGKNIVSEQCQKCASKSGTGQHKRDRYFWGLVWGKGVYHPMAMFIILRVILTLVLLLTLNWSSVLTLSLLQP